MSYPGGKNGHGVYQTIINQIPPHRVYIETHLGGGAILRKKRPAEVSIGLDADPAVIEVWQAHPERPPRLTLHHADAAAWLQAHPFRGDEFVYLDPPYLMETRKGGRLYAVEYTRAQHVELLDVILALPAMVMISGYWSKLYAEALEDWRTLNFQAQTRQGTATEWLWMNYPEPVELHDYRYLGSDFRERERLKRIKASWMKRLRKLSPLERRMLFAAARDVAEEVNSS
ncbi:MAG: DNA adenine methylase [Bacteroidota bacterium]